MFFRESLSREAESAGASGWVRNRGDGAVEGVVEGTRETIDAVLAAIRSGPGDSEVEGLDVADETPEGLGGFSVRK